MLTDVFLVILLLVFTCYWFWNRSSYVKRINEIPRMKGIYLPILGNGLGAILNINKNIIDWTMKNVDISGISHIRVPGNAVIVISNATYANLILKSVKYIPKGDFYSFFADWIPLGFVNGKRLNRGTHKLRRKKYSPMVQSNSLMQEFVHVFNKYGLVMNNRLANPNAENKVDIFSYSGDCSFDIIYETILGVPGTAQTQEGSSYQAAVDQLTNISLQRYLMPWLQPKWLWNMSSLKRKYEKNLNVVAAYDKQVVLQRMEEIENLTSEEDFTPKCVLDKMILLDTDLDEIISYVNGFIFAGYDSVGSEMGWFLAVMGTYPEVQDKVVEELMDVFGDSGRLPDVKDLENLNYLEMCIKETMRLFPAVPGMERKSKQPLEIGKYTVPENTSILVLIYAVHRNPEYYPNPEKFIPERFSPENIKNIPAGAFIAFSDGDQSCFGKNFAMLEMKSILSTVLRRYRIESLKNVHDIGFCCRMILQPKEGLFIRAFERQSHPYLRAAQ